MISWGLRHLCVGLALLGLGITTAHADLEKTFTGAKGFAPLDVAKLEARFDRILSNTSANPGPVDKAIGLLLAHEPVLERVRLRVTFGQQTIEQPNGASTVVAFVEVTRLNLGPTIRRSAIASYGAENVGPATEFGVGPHVSLRATFSGLRGASAVLRQASRSQVTDTAARGLRCLGIGCLSEAPAGERGDWKPKKWMRPKVIARSAGQDTVSPVDMARWVLAGANYIEPKSGAWREPEARESVKPGGSFITLVIDQNLGQDTQSQAILRETDLMDDDLSEQWLRASSTGDAAEAIIRRRK
jgi:hypothetical protein